MKSMEEMMQAAQQAAETIQKQMGDMQVKLDAIEVEGQAGGGLVKVRASAKGRILGVTIDDSLMKPEEKNIVEDLVTAAFNDARDKADRVSEEQMKEMQGGMGLPPGFNLPGMSRSICSIAFKSKSPTVWSARIGSVRPRSDPPTKNWACLQSTSNRR